MFYRYTQTYTHKGLNYTIPCSCFTNLCKIGDTYEWTEMAYTAFHTNSCTQIRGGSNTEILRKMQENVTKTTPPLSTMIWKDSSGLSNKHSYDSNPSLDKVL